MDSGPKSGDIYRDELNNRIFYIDTVVAGDPIDRNVRGFTMTQERHKNAGLPHDRTPSREEFQAYGSMYACSFALFEANWKLVKDPIAALVKEQSVGND